MRQLKDKNKMNIPRPANRCSLKKRQLEEDSEQGQDALALSTYNYLLV